MAVIYKFGCLLVLWMVVVAPYAEALTCGEVVSKMQPCLTYLRGTGPVTPGCCGGVKSLNSEANTTPLRQQACGCLKQASTSIAGIKPALASGLAGKCGVSIPYPISPSTDCSKVK